MSCRVLVIPEDPTYNGYILEPFAQRILAECGKPNVKTKVLTDPRLRGFAHASSMIEEIAERYSHFDLMLFLVDADGRDRSAALADLERRAAERRAARLLRGATGS